VQSSAYLIERVDGSASFHHQEDAALLSFEMASFGASGEN
jgi:hypothetical protein